MLKSPGSPTESVASGCSAERLTRQARLDTVRWFRKYPERALPNFGWQSWVARYAHGTQVGFVCDILKKIYRRTSCQYLGVVHCGLSQSRLRHPPPGWAMRAGTAKRSWPSSDSAKGARPPSTVIHGVAVKEVGPQIIDLPYYRRARLRSQSCALKRRRSGGDPLRLFSKAKY